MTIQAEKAKLKTRAIFEVNKAIETLFFSTPLSLELLKKAAILALLKLSEKLYAELLAKYGDKLTFDPKNKKDLEQFIKTNPDTKNIVNFASTTLNEDFINDLLVKCQLANNTTDENINPSFIPNNEISEESINELINQLSIENNDDKNIFEKLNDLLAKLNLSINSLIPYLSGALMVYYIIEQIIQLFQYTEFPSLNRTKYIGKLIKTTIVALGKNILSEFDELFSLIKILSFLDALIATVVPAFILYLLNRKKLQNFSREQLIDNICPDYPKDSLTPFDKEIEFIPLDISSNILSYCDLPDSKDNIITPIQSFESKSANINDLCSVEEETKEDKPLGDSKPLIVTHAIIENKRKSNMNILVQPNAKIFDSTKIATIDNDSLYSPVNGVVEKIEDNKIYVKELSDISESFLEKTIKSLTDLYSKLNDSKEFIKTWVIPTLYPKMLFNSPSFDNVLTKEELAIIKYDSVFTQFSNIQAAYNNDLNIFNNNIQVITGEANVKIHAEDETLEVIQEDIKKEEDILLSKIINYRISSAGIAKLAKAKDGEYILVDYYFELILKLLEINNKTTYESELLNTLSSFLRKRLTMDSLDPKNISNKINVLGADLLGEFAINNFFEEGMNIYNQSNKISDIEDWLKHICIENKAIEEKVKISLINKIYYLYQFYLNINDYKLQYASLTPDKRNLEIEKESKAIDALINKIFQELNSIPNEIEYALNLINDISITTTFSTISIKGVSYNHYVIVDEEKPCLQADLDVNLGGPTVTNFGDIKYWRRYCALATLASCASPGTGWATGFITPVGPILFPIIYIPIKAIQTQYGFIVFGLTITGIVPMPMVLLVNMGTNFELPLIDPVKALKNEIKALKLDLSSQLEDFKLVTLKQLLDVAKKDLDDVTEQYNKVVANQKEHKTKKPPNTKKYIKERAEWAITNLEFIKLKIEFGEKRFLAATKYSIIYTLYTVGGSASEMASNSVDAVLNAIKSTEKIINAQFDNLAELAKQLELIIGPLPITLLPDSANFGFTLKMPIPIFNFATNLSAEHLQLTILDDILNKFKVSNEMLTLASPTFMSYKELKDLIQMSLSFLIINDPFPPYEKLKITYPPLILFLFTKFVPGGARVFGMPGMP